MVLTPRLMQLRRLVIGEVSRFPGSGEGSLRKRTGAGDGRPRGEFRKPGQTRPAQLDDPKIAASHFNWLVMSDALNQAMLLGDGAIPKPAELRRHAAEGVRVFLAAYGKKR